MRRILTGSFARYCFGGALGFAVDAGTVILLKKCGLNPFASRAVSIHLALAVPWAYHRNVTFSPSGCGLLAELGRYYVSNAVGAGVNYGVYSLWLVVFAPKDLLVPLAAASILALAFNYLMARVYIFRVT